MNILEAYDLTGSFRDAGELAGCSHHTVARYVRAREEGRLVPGAPSPRPGVIDGFLPKLEELVERSKGRVRADVAHEKITAMGFAGSERTTRRAVARLKKAWHSGRRRVFRPVGPGAGDVGAVRLRGRPGGRRGGDGAVLPVAGLVEVPGRAPAAGQDPGVGLGRRRRRAAPGRRGAGLPADRQREDGHRRARGRDAGAEPRGGGVRPALRADGRDLRALRPGVQGGVGVHGQAGQGRPGAHGREPAARSTAASRLWRRRAPSSASRSTPGRTGSPAGVPAEMLAEEASRLHPVPAVPVHRGAGRDPPGRRDVAGHVRGRPVLGPAPAGRAGRARPPARGAGRHRPRRPAGAGRGGHATGSPRRAARAWTTRTTRPPRPGR